MMNVDEPSIYFPQKKGVEVLASSRSMKMPL
jgi:hypothetical protein